MGVSCPSSGTCYMVTTQGIMLTTNGGATWLAVLNFVSGPATSGPTHASNAEACPGTLTCFMVSSNGQVYQTTSGGQTWSAGPLGLGANSGNDVGGNPSSLAVLSCPSTSTCVAAGATTSAGPPLVMQTTNAGLSWSNLSSGVPSIGNVMAIACPSMTECVLGTNTNTDVDVGNPQTNSWQSLVSLGNDGSVTGLTCPTTTECFGVTSNGDVLAGTGAGLSSWTVTAPASGLTSLSGVACTSTTACVAVGNATSGGAIYETSNAGSTWSLDSTATGTDLLGVSCLTSGSCVLVGQSGSVYQGSPGSWTNVTPSGEPPSPSPVPTVACDGSGNCIAASTADGDSNAMFLTNDGIAVPVSPEDGEIVPSEMYGGHDEAEPCFACALKAYGLSAEAWYGDPVNTADGDYSESFPLFSVPARGLPFGFSLTYDAQLAQSQVAAGATSSGPYGWGWTAPNDLSITAGPGSSQVTVNQDGGSQVVYNEGSTMGGVTAYSAMDSHRVMATLTFSSSTNEYTFSLNGGVEQYLFSAAGPDAAGTLVAEQDANGNTTTFGTESASSGRCPNTASNCDTITDPAGRSITIVNASSALVSEVIDPAGSAWTLAYDSNGNLTSVTDPLTNETSFDYDTTNSNGALVHDLTTITKPANQTSGAKTTNTYDDSGRVVSQTDPTGLTTSYSYEGDNESPTGGTTTITDPHGNVTTQDYAYGVLWSTTNAVGTPAQAIWSYQRDPGTLMPTEVIDPNGNISTSTFDTQGNPTSVTDALGNTTSTTYNSFNEPLTVTDPKGITTTYTYDSHGNRLSKTVGGSLNVADVLGWASASVDSGSITAAACPAVSLCVATDQSGHVLTSSNPAGGPSAWTNKFSVDSNLILAVSCPSTSLCVATDFNGGNILTSSNPAGGSSAWSSTHVGQSLLPTIDCPSTTLCVAGAGGGNILTSTNPAGGVWGTPTDVDGSNTIAAINCPSTSFCVAGDEEGNILTSTNPAGGVWSTPTNVDGSTRFFSMNCLSVSVCIATDGAGNVLSSVNGGASWTKVNIAGTLALLQMSCPSQSLCVTSDQAGDVFTSTNPTGTSSAWSRIDVDGANDIYALSCPSLALCVGGDAAGNILVPTASPSWTPSLVDSGNSVLAASCPTTTMCVSTDNSGDVVTSTNPTGGTSAWTTRHIDGTAKIVAISCPSTSLCVATANNGYVLYSSTPTGAASTWIKRHVDGTAKINAISCPTVSLCVATDVNGDILYSTTPTGAASTWMKTHIDTSTSINAISCPVTTLCVVTDANGNVITSINPTGGTSFWTNKFSVDSVNLPSVSCPTVALCVATDAGGNALSSTTPTGGAGHWTKTNADGSTDLPSVGCPSASLCVATDAQGKVVTSTNPGGAVWNSPVDVDGSAAMNGVTCPTETLCVAVDAAGQVVTSPDPGGFATLATAFTSDGSGDLTSITDPDGNVTTYTYDTYGDVATKSSTAGGQTDTTSDSYDSLGRLYCQVSPNAYAASVTCPSSQSTRVADTTSSIFDANGNVTSTTDADGNMTSYLYDADGNKTLTTDPVGNETKTLYDADDRVTSGTDGYGSTSPSTITYNYDIAPGSGSCSSPPTGTTYCTEVVNGLSNGTTNYFNALDQMIESAPPYIPDQAVTTYTYDGAGNVLTMTDTAGVTTYTYDADNREKGISYSDTTAGYATPHAVTYQYDTDGNRTQMTDGTGTTSYAYDDFGRLRSVTDGAGNRVTYGYDPAGYVTCLSYPNIGSTTCQSAETATGLVAYTYDAVGRVAQMADWLSPASPTVFSYDNDSNLTETTLPPSTTTTQSHAYDSTDAVTDTSYKIAGTTTDLANLTRNADELIKTTTPPSGGSTTFSYNPLNQVTAGTTTDYGYDAAGQLCWTGTTSGTPTCSTPPTSATSYAYNADGQLCWTASSAGSCTSAPGGAATYADNLSGERISSTPSGGNPTTYGWDQSGDLTCETAANASSYSCTAPNSSVTSTFAYNGDGLRMSDTPSGGMAQPFTWDTSSSVSNLLEDGTNYYLYGPNVGSAPVEQIVISGSAPSYLISDTTGIRVQIGSTGSLIGSGMSYDSYGNRCGGSCSISTPFGFEGEYTDVTGLDYLIHRYYDPATAQFLSSDPLVDVTGQPYSYAGNDPVNGSDPSGLCDVPSGDSNEPFVHTHNGACTSAEVYLIQSQANAINHGSSIYAGEASAGGSLGIQFNPVQGLEGGVNTLRGLGNSGLKFYDFTAHTISLHNVNPCFGVSPIFQGSTNPLVGSDFNIGNNVGNVELSTPSPEAWLARSLAADIYLHILRFQLAR